MHLSIDEKYLNTQNFRRSRFYLQVIRIHGCKFLNIGRIKRLISLYFANP